MRFNRLLTCVVAIGSMLALGSQALADGLTVDSWQLDSSAYVAGTVRQYEIDSNTTVVNPFIGATIANPLHGNSTTNYDFSWDASGGSFAVDMVQWRNRTRGSYAKSVGSINFTVTGDAMNYDLSGVYTLEGNRVILGDVRLFKDGVPVFEWVQKDDFDPPAPPRGEDPIEGNTSLVVGQAGDGGVVDILVGSPTGTLVPGHSYELRYEFSTDIPERYKDIGTDVSGNFLMTLTRITPEELTVNLVEDVIVLNLNNGINNALDSKLDAVMEALDDTNENNDGAACNALNAFINSTLAQSGNHIPEADAIDLIDAALLIIEVLCSS